MTRDELEAERTDLQRKLKARERAGGGYAANIAAIKTRLAEIEEELKRDG